MGHHKHNASRRRFMGQAACAAVGTTTLFSSINSLGMLNALARPKPFAFPPVNDGYRAMVCVLLGGGNDSYNMLVPTTSEAYDMYAASRSNLALPQSDLLGLNYTDGDGYQYGLHPAMPEMQALFDDSKLAMIANVGTLIEPVTKAQILAGTAPLPLGLLSHSDQVRHWQTSMPHTRSAKGWGGRMADILYTLNDSQDVSMSISLSGTNIFQAGNTVQEFAVTPNGSVGIGALTGSDFLAETLGAGVQSLLDQEYFDLFKQTYATKVNSSQDQHEAFAAAIEGLSPFATSFPGDRFGQNLNMVAQSIAAAPALGMNRQIFFVHFGGWDHHDEVLGNQEFSLSSLSQGLASFQATMEELGLADCVTTFTISDFARTLTSNGNGTDHGWGGNCMVMGGAVNGGQLYGSYPTLQLDSDLEVGGGVLIPTMSTDVYFAELCLWFGLDPTNLTDVLPNIENFYTYEPDAPHPVGFMNY